MRIFCLVVVVFVVCWFLILVLGWFWIVLGMDSIYWGYVFYKIVMFGVFINEVINFVIYCVFDRSLKVRISFCFFCRDFLLEVIGFS